MAAHQVGMRRDDSKRPHAYLPGLNLPANFALPDLELVRSEADIALDEIRTPSKEETITVVKPGLGAMILNYALSRSVQYPNLFRFAMYCAVDEVPNDILPQCIWACEFHIRALETSTVEQLKHTGALLPHQSANVQYTLLQTLRIKMTEYCLLPQIDKPIEALRHYHTFMKTNEEQRGVTDPWKGNMSGLQDYAIVLARSRTDDAEAKKLLTKTTNTGSGLELRHLVVGKIYLARVLRRLGETKNAETMEKWLINWFKKNPNRINDNILVPLFTTDIDPKTDPVLLGLGGSGWLEERRATLRSEHRIARICRNCGKKEPEVKLMQCSRCKHIYYCSRECQKINHPYHKEQCKEAAAQLAHIAKLKESGQAAEARRAAQWQEFRTLPALPANTTLLAHALCLKRDPSRARTHIVVKVVQHQPHATHAHDHFRFTHVGVFKLDDIYPEIEGIMGLNKGEGRIYIREMLEEFDAGPGRENKKEGANVRYPIFDLAFSPEPGHVQAYLSYGGMDHNTIMRNPYDPDWRKKMNRAGPPPEPVQFVRRNIKDAEHIFD